MPRGKGWRGEGGLKNTVALEERKRVKGLEGGLKNAIALLKRLRLLQVPNLRPDCVAGAREPVSS